MLSSTPDDQTVPPKMPRFSDLLMNRVCSDCIHSLIRTRTVRVHWKAVQAFHKNVCEIHHTSVQK